MKRFSQREKFVSRVVNKVALLVINVQKNIRCSRKSYNNDVYIKEL